MNDQMQQHFFLGSSPPLDYRMLLFPFSASIMLLLFT